MSVIRDIKVAYNDLKPMQKKIADYFLKIDFEELNSSIEEIAGNIGTSVASISRFCKRLGYDSFKRFKMTFSRDLQYEPEQVLPIFNREDEAQLSIRKVFAEAVTNIQATEGAVDSVALVKVEQKIRKSKMVYFFGLGGSGRIGELGQIQISHLGYKAKAIIDPYEMLVCSGHKHSGDIFICISHSGRQKQVIEAAELAQKNGGYIVGMTNYPESKLASFSDVVLLTACHERSVHFAMSNSMVAQLTLLRAIYILLASKSDITLIDEVSGIETMVNKNLRIK